jgi:hypothetical protein
VVLEDVLASVDQTHHDLGPLLPELRSAAVARRALWHRPLPRSEPENP